MLERVERLVAGDLDLEAVACLLVLDRDRDGVRLGVPAEDDVESAAAAAGELSNSGVGGGGRHYL